MHMKLEEKADLCQISEWYIFKWCFSSWNDPVSGEFFVHTLKNSGDFASQLRGN